MTNVPGADERDGQTAVRAWQRLRSGGPPPTRVETLKATVGTTVCRLHGVGPAGTPIIAKRSYEDDIGVERIVYEEVLPTLPLPALRCYGGVEAEDDAGSWIFLEDAGGRPYSEMDAGDRALATGWLGIMHTATARCDLAVRFPPIGPDRYLGYIRLTRTRIEDHLARSGRHRQARSCFKRIIRHLNRLEQRWPFVETQWSRMPHCLVHRDFLGGNVRIRGEAGRSTLYVLDWGNAGWGVPAGDVAGLDADMYWGRVRGSWSTFGRALIQAMVELGDVLRYLDWMESTTQYLGSAEDSWIEDDLALYEPRLARARAKAGLT